MRFSSILKDIFSPLCIEYSDICNFLKVTFELPYTFGDPLLRFTSLLPSHYIYEFPIIWVWQPSVSESPGHLCIVYKLIKGFMFAILLCSMSQGWTDLINRVLSHMSMKLQCYTV